MTSSLKGLKDKIDDFLEPEPPDEEEPIFIETYREIDIYWYPIAEEYRAEIPGVAVAFGDTLEEVKEAIDDVLDSLEPPEVPPDGLLAQIVAWIEKILADIIEPLRAEWDTFITYTWPALGTVLTDLGDAWDTFKTTTLVTITDTLTSLGDAWDVFTGETLPGIWDTIDEKVGNLKTAIMEDLADLRASMDQGLADNREWTTNFFKLMDPTGFLKDPLGTVKAAFAIWRLAADHVVVESFLEGFEEGLEE